MNCKNKFFHFLSIWGVVTVWQLLLVLLMFRSFASGLFPDGVVSYVFSAGYLLDYVIGGNSWGPMSLSNGRWIVGMITMLCVSGFAVFSQNDKCRCMARALFVFLHLTGSFCTFINMGSAIP